MRNILQKFSWIALATFLLAGLAPAQTNLYVTMGSDFNRGSNVYTLGIGRTLNSTDTNVLGSELVLNYSYETDRSRGILLGSRSAQTEAFGMRGTLTIPGMRFTMYSLPLMGMTSLDTPGSTVRRFYAGAAFGTIWRLSAHHAIVFQDLTAITPNTDTTLSVGYRWSY